MKKLMIPVKCIWIVLGLLAFTATSNNAAGQVATTAMAPGMPTVAMIPFEVTTTKPSVGALVMETVEQVFTERKFRVLPSAQVVQGCQTLGIAQQGAVSDANMLELGTACGARFVVWGSIEICAKRTYHWNGARVTGWAYLDSKVMDVQARTVVLERTHYRPDKPHELRWMKVSNSTIWGGSRAHRQYEAMGMTLEGAYGSFLDALLMMQSYGMPGVAVGTGAQAADTGAQAAGGSQQAAVSNALTVSVTNGDVVKGTVVTPNQIVIEAAYGTVTLKWEDISVLTLHKPATDEADRASLKNGAVVSGGLGPFTLVLRLDNGQQVSLGTAQMQSITVGAGQDQ